MELVESVRRLRGMSNLARTAGLLVALSVPLAGCVGTGASESAVHGLSTPSPVAETNAEGVTGPKVETTPQKVAPPGPVTDAEASRFVDLATRQVRGASAYAADALQGMAASVCQVLELGAGLSGAVDVLDNYRQIAPQERETIVQIAADTACPENRFVKK